MIKNKTDAKTLHRIKINNTTYGFTPITSQIPYWLYEKIEKEASKRNLSKSAYVREILLRIFEENLKSSELNEKSKVV